MRKIILTASVLALLLVVCVVQTTAQSSTITPSVTPETGQGEWTVFIIPDGKPDGEMRDQWIADISTAGDGTIWATLRRDGMAYFDRAGWHTLHDVTQSLVGEPLWFYCCFTTAPDGTVWFNYLHLLGRYDGEDWLFYSSEGSPERWGNYLIDEVLKPQGVSTAIIKDILPFDKSIALDTDSKGALWVATAGGMVRFDGQTWATFRAGEEMPPGAIHTMTVAPDDSVWVDTNRGLHHYDGH